MGMIIFKNNFTISFFSQNKAYFRIIILTFSIFIQKIGLFKGFFVQLYISYINT